MTNKKQNADIYKDEINVLSSAIVSESVCDYIVTALKLEDFPTKEYRKIFQAIVFLKQQNKKVGLPEICHYSKDFGYDTMSPINVSAGVVYSVDVVQELVDNLKLHRIKKEINEKLPLLMSEDEFKYDNHQEKLSTFVENLDNDQKVPTVQTLTECLQNFKEGLSYLDYVKNIVENYRKSGKGPGIETGFERLDEIIQFIPPYAYVLIGAKTSVGKTSFSMGLIKQFMKQGKKCAILSFEMDKYAVIDKYVSLITCIPVEKIKKGTLTQEEIHKVEAIQNLLEHSFLYICETFSPTIESVVHKIKKLKKIHGVEVIMIDYLTKIRAPAEFPSNHLKVDHISKSLQRVALDENVILLVLAQFNRQSSYDERPPTLKDFRESGSIEEDADLCLLLHRPIVHIQPPKNMNAYELEKWKDDAKLLRVFVAKNRVIGTLGGVKFDYNLEKGWHELEYVDELEEEKRNIRLQELKRKEEARLIDKNHLNKFEHFSP